MSLNMDGLDRNPVLSKSDMAKQSAALQPAPPLTMESMMNFFASDRRSLLSCATTAMIAGMVPVTVDAQPLQSQSNKAKVEAALTAWSKGTNDALFQLFSDDIRWTIVGHSLISGTYVGKAELTAKVNTPFAARFAKSSEKFRPARIHGVYGDGDIVIAHFDGRGVPNDGQVYANSYAWFLRMVGGHIVEATAFYDSVAFDDFWRRVPI